MALHELDLETIEGSVVKVKGSKPPHIEEFASYIYKNTLYLRGGENVAQQLYVNFLWGLDFAKKRWKEVSA